MSLLLSEIIDRLGGQLGGEDVQVRRIVSLSQSDSEGLAYLGDPKHKSLLTKIIIGAVIVRLQDAEGLDLPHIIVDNPHAYFAKAARLLYPLPHPVPGVDQSAILACGATIDPTAEIGPQVVVGKGAIIGPNVVIKSGAIIGEDVVIGAGSLIYPRVVIYQGCTIGKRVIIHAGAVIGSDGFGNAWDHNHWEKIPQLGYVRIGDDVEIGANTTIDRGAIQDTMIAEGVRIDNLVQIAHNVKIGAHTAIAACTGIAGSTQIGAGCLIGGGVGISGHLKITDGVTILGGSGVASDIEKPGVFASGNPVLPHSTWLRNSIHLRYLDQLFKRVKGIEKAFSILKLSVQPKQGKL